MGLDTVRVSSRFISEHGGGKSMASTLGTISWIANMIALGTRCLRHDKRRLLPVANLCSILPGCGFVPSLGDSVVKQYDTRDWSSSGSLVRMGEGGGEASLSDCESDRRSVSGRAIRNDSPSPATRKISL